MNRTAPIIAILLLTACSGGGGRTINLAIEGAGGQMAYFDRFENNRPVHVDSVKLDGDGQGTMRLAPLPLDFYRIAIGAEQLIVVLDSAESLDVVAKSGAVASPERLEGSKHTQLFIEFQTLAGNFDRQRDSLRTVMTADPANSAALDRLNALNSQHYTDCRTFVQQNSTTPAVISAANRLNKAQELELLKKVRDDLRTVMPRSGFFAAFRDEIDRMDQQQLMIKMQEEEMKRLSNLLPIGGEAPEIRQQTPDGGTMALSELRGKYVLIDFWASWCRPCRMENPAMKQVYEKYRRKGFEIFGVSLDRDHGAWVAAIQQDGINWKHVSDLGFWNNAAAQEYGVSSIPFTVLLDKDGRIIEKGLRSHDLDLKLAQVLGS